MPRAAYFGCLSSLSLLFGHECFTRGPTSSLLRCRCCCEARVQLSLSEESATRRSVSHTKTDAAYPSPEFTDTDSSVFLLFAQKNVRLPPTTKAGLPGSASYVPP
jgi:hypothetical protein